MSIMKLNFSFSGFLFWAMLTTLATINTSLPAKSQSLSELEQAAEEIDINFIPVHANEGGDADEDNTIGQGDTGSRGDCEATAIPLTRLVGQPNFLHLTANPYPTFWFYIPYRPEQVTSGIFSLQDPGGFNEYWQTSVQFPENTNQSIPGIVSITLPDTIDPLEVDFVYQWFLDFDCPGPDNSDEFASPASISGQVQRVEVSLELEQELNSATNPLKKAEIYADNSIWYDVVTEVAQVYLDNPDSERLGGFWRGLLENIGFGPVASEPLIGPLDISNPEDSQ